MEMPRSRTLPDLLDEMATRHPDHEFVVGGADRLTYAQFRERVRELAKGFHALGVEREDKVALLMNNRTEWLLVDFAVQLLGATLVAVSTWSRERELEYVLDHSDASTLITIDRFRDHDYLAMLEEIATRLPKLARVVSLGGERGPGAPELPLDVTPFDQLWTLGATVSDAELDARQRAVTPEDVAYILYTSGTTSTPKGVQLQHRGLVENMWNIG